MEGGLYSAGYPRPTIFTLKVPHFTQGSPLWKGPSLSRRGLTLKKKFFHFTDKPSALSESFINSHVIHLTKGSLWNSHLLIL
jgi:hypothetical protein